MWTPMVFKIFRVKLDFSRHNLCKLRLGLVEILTEFCLEDLKRIMKTRKIMLHGLLTINHMIMGHRDAYPSLAGSKTACSWFL